MFCWPYPCGSLPFSCPLETDRTAQLLEWPHIKVAHGTPHPRGSNPVLYHQAGFVYGPRPSWPFHSAEKQGSFLFFHKKLCKPWPVRLSLSA